MRELTLLAVMAVLTATACSAAGDAAIEKTMEAQLGYDVEIYYDEDGERQARPVDGPIAWEIDFDRGRLGDLPIPDGYIVADDQMSDASTLRIQLIALTEQDAAAAADAYASQLEAGGWTVTRAQRDDGKVDLDFARGDASGKAVVATEPMFGVVTISLNYTADTSTVGGRTIPEPDGMSASGELSGGTQYDVPGEDVNAIAAAYAEQLEAAGWTVDEVAPADGGAVTIVFSGDGRLGAASVFPATDDAPARIWVRLL